MPASGLYDGTSLYQPVRGRSFDDSEPFKQTGRARGLPENNLLKSFAADKEKASSVAKIKVVVCSCCSFIIPSKLLPSKYLNELQC